MAVQLYHGALAAGQFVADYPMPAAYAYAVVVGSLAVPYYFPNITTIRPPFDPWPVNSTDIDNVYHDINRNTWSDEKTLVESIWRRLETSSNKKLPTTVAECEDLNERIDFYLTEEQGYTPGLMHPVNCTARYEGYQPREPWTAPDISVLPAWLQRWLEGPKTQDPQGEIKEQPLPSASQKEKPNITVTTTVTVTHKEWYGGKTGHPTRTLRPQQIIGTPCYLPDCETWTMTHWVWTTESIFPDALTPTAPKTPRSRKASTPIDSPASTTDKGSGHVTDKPGTEHRGEKTTAGEDTVERKDTTKGTHPGTDPKGHRFWDYVYWKKSTTKPQDATTGSEQMKDQGQARSGVSDEGSAAGYVTEKSTTRNPATSKTTTREPSKYRPLQSKSRKHKPSTRKPSTSEPSIVEPSIVEPSIVEPSTNSTGQALTKLPTMPDTKKSILAWGLPLSVGPTVARCANIIQKGNWALLRNDIAWLVFQGSTMLPGLSYDAKSSWCRKTMATMFKPDLFADACSHVDERLRRAAFERAVLEYPVPIWFRWVFSCVSAPLWISASTLEFVLTPVVETLSRWLQYIIGDEWPTFVTDTVEWVTTKWRLGHFRFPESGDEFARFSLILATTVIAHGYPAIHNWFPTFSDLAWYSQLAFMAWSLRVLYAHMGGFSFLDIMPLGFGYLTSWYLYRFTQPEFNTLVRLPRMIIENIRSLVRNSCGFVFLDALLFLAMYYFFTPAEQCPHPSLRLPMFLTLSLITGYNVERTIAMLIRVQQEGAIQSIVQSRETPVAVRLRSIRIIVPVVSLFLASSGWVYQYLCLDSNLMIAAAILGARIGYFFPAPPLSEVSILEQIILRPVEFANELYDKLWKIQHDSVGHRLMSWAAWLCLIVVSTGCFIVANTDACIFGSKDSAQCPVVNIDGWPAIFILTSAPIIPFIARLYCLEHPEESKRKLEGPLHFLFWRILFASVVVCTIWFRFWGTCPHDIFLIIIIILLWSLVGWKFDGIGSSKPPEIENIDPRSRDHREERGPGRVSERGQPVAMFHGTVPLRDGGQGFLYSHLMPADGQPITVDVGQHPSIQNTEEFPQGLFDASAPMILVEATSGQRVAIPGHPEISIRHECASGERSRRGGGEGGERPNGSQRSDTGRPPSDGGPGNGRPNGGLPGQSSSPPDQEIRQEEERQEQRRRAELQWEKLREQEQRLQAEERQQKLCEQELRKQELHEREQRLQAELHEQELHQQELREQERRLEAKQHQQELREQKIHEREQQLQAEEQRQQELREQEKRQEERRDKEIREEEQREEEERQEEQRQEEQSKQQPSTGQAADEPMTPERSLEQYLRQSTDNPSSTDEGISSDEGDGQRGGNLFGGKTKRMPFGNGMKRTPFGDGMKQMPFGLEKKWIDSTSQGLALDGLGSKSEKPGKKISSNRSLPKEPKLPGDTLQSPQGSFSSHSTVTSEDEDELEDEELEDEELEDEELEDEELEDEELEEEETQDDEESVDEKEPDDGEEHMPTIPKTDTIAPQGGLFGDQTFGVEGRHNVDKSEASVVLPDGETAVAEAGQTTSEPRNWSDSQGTTPRTDEQAKKGPSSHVIVEHVSVTSEVDTLQDPVSPDDGQQSQTAKDKTPETSSSKGPTGSSPMYPGCHEKDTTTPEIPTPEITPVRNEDTVTEEDSLHEESNFGTSGDEVFEDDLKVINIMEFTGLNHTEAMQLLGLANGDTEEAIDRFHDGTQHKSVRADRLQDNKTQDIYTCECGEEVNFNDAATHAHSARHRTALQDQVRLLQNLENTWENIRIEETFGGSDDNANRSEELKKLNRSEKSQKPENDIGSQLSDGDFAKIVEATNCTSRRMIEALWRLAGEDINGAIDIFYDRGTRPIPYERCPVCGLDIDLRDLDLHYESKEHNWKFMEQILEKLPYKGGSDEYINRLMARPRLLGWIRRTPVPPASDPDRWEYCATCDRIVPRVGHGADHTRNDCEHRQTVDAEFGKPSKFQKHPQCGICGIRFSKESGSTNFISLVPADWETHQRLRYHLQVIVQRDEANGKAYCGVCEEWLSLAHLEEHLDSKDHRQREEQMHTDKRRPNNVFCEWCRCLVTRDAFEDHKKSKEHRRNKRGGGDGGEGIDEGGAGRGRPGHHSGSGGEGVRNDSDEDDGQDRESGISELRLALSHIVAPKPRPPPAEDTPSNVPKNKTQAAKDESLKQNAGDEMLTSGQNLPKERIDASSSQEEDAGPVRFVKPIGAEEQPTNLESHQKAVNSADGRSGRAQQKHQGTHNSGESAGNTEEVDRTLTHAEKQNKRSKVHKKKKKAEMVAAQKEAAEKDNLPTVDTTTKVPPANPARAKRLDKRTRDKLKQEKEEALAQLDQEQERFDQVSTKAASRSSGPTKDVGEESGRKSPGNHRRGKSGKHTKDLYRDERGLSSCKKGNREDTPGYMQQQVSEQVPKDKLKEIPLGDPKGINESSQSATGTQGGNYQQATVGKYNRGNGGEDRDQHGDRLGDGSQDRAEKKKKVRGLNLKRRNFETTEEFEAAKEKKKQNKKDREARAGLGSAGLGPANTSITATRNASSSHPLGAQSHSAELPPQAGEGRRAEIKAAGQFRQSENLHTNRSEDGGEQILEEDEQSGELNIYMPGSHAKSEGQLLNAKDAAAFQSLLHQTRSPRLVELGSEVNERTRKFRSDQEQRRREIEAELLLAKETPTRNATEALRREGVSNEAQQYLNTEGHFVPQNLSIKEARHIWANLPAVPGIPGSAPILNWQNYLGHDPQAVPAVLSNAPIFTQPTRQWNDEIAKEWRDRAALGNLYTKWESSLAPNPMPVRPHSIASHRNVVSDIWPFNIHARDGELYVRNVDSESDALIDLGFVRHEERQDRGRSQPDRRRGSW